MQSISGDDFIIRRQVETSIVLNDSTTHITRVSEVRQVVAASKPLLPVPAADHNRRRLQLNVTMGSPGPEPLRDPNMSQEKFR